MKKILPILFGFVFFFSFVLQSHAQINISQAPSPAPTTGAVPGKWAKDQEVTFVGKTATRANGFLEWTLQNYGWIDIPNNATTNPIQDFWALVRNIVFVLMALFVLGAAFVMIVTRGQNLTLMKFAPRFVFIVILVVLSFALVRFLYQAVDVVQGFFLRVDDPITGQPREIGPQDLLYIAFNYETFTGYRQVGFEYDESAFISLLLVKLTAITYYVMTGLLLIRKIILWFFIIVSPIFPLLLFFRPVRNTAKIWVGEFFRWLLYAPLFALFLHGLVQMWRDRIPLNFDFTTPGQVPGTDVIYPTAINILLGGPGQTIGINNSVNLRDTFALYVVALLMLWVVILLPFLLLQIFLDYLNNVSITENPIYKRIASSPIMPRSFGGAQPPPGSPTPQPAPFGLAKSLPFFNKRAMQIPTQRSQSATRNENIMSQVSATNLATVRETKDVLRLANLSIPKMRDIARYETSMMKHDTVSKQEVSRFHETLERISKPTVVAQPADREKFTTIKEKLVTQQQKGDKLASSVLEASKVSEKEKSKTKAVVPGQKPEQATKDVNLPTVNNVQQVSIEEYEEVKKMWQENYQNLQAPVGENGTPIDKKTFIQEDIRKITETINLLSSDSPENVDKGMEQVANILPFLLIGGFTKTEVVSYLKAKLEAAKSVAQAQGIKQEDEDTLLDRKTEHKEEAGKMQMEQELPLPGQENKPQDPGLPTQQSQAPGEEGVLPEQNTADQQAQSTQDKSDNNGSGNGGGQPPQV